MVEPFCKNWVLTLPLWLQDLCLKNHPSLLLFGVPLVSYPYLVQDCGVEGKDSQKSSFTLTLCFWRGKTFSSR